MSSYFGIDFVSKKNPEVKMNMMWLSTTPARELDTEMGGLVYGKETTVNVDFLNEVLNVYTTQAEVIRTNIANNETMIARLVEIMKTTPSMEIYKQNAEEVSYLEGYRKEYEEELDYAESLAKRMQTLINIYKDNSDYKTDEPLFDIVYLYE